MGYFAQPGLGRSQRMLIPTTLEDAVPGDHEVRILDEVLRVQDWSAWEGEYCQRRGQPPLHPRVLASRSLGRIAMTMGVVRLGEVTFDGTRTKANNDRFETWTAAEVEKRLAELVEQFGQGLEEAERTDAADDDRFALTPGMTLPSGLADAESDRYYCPQGQPLELDKTKGDTRQGQKITLRVYRCESCVNCPLASRCISEKNPGSRALGIGIQTVTRSWCSCPIGQKPRARLAWNEICPKSRGI